MGADGGLEHEELDGRVEALARHDVRRRRQEVHVPWRDVALQVVDPPGEGHAGQVGKPPHVGLGPVDVHEGHVVGEHDGPDDPRLGCRDDEQAVHRTAEQGLGAVHARHVHAGNGVLGEIVGLEDFPGEHPRAAPGQADGHAPAAQLREAGDVLAPPAEDPEGLVGHAAQGHQVRRLLAPADSALDEGEVDARAGVQQQVVVVHRSFGRPQVQPHPVLGQDAAVVITELGIAAARHAGGHGDVIGRRRLEKFRGEPEPGDGDQHGRRADQQPLSQVQIGEASHGSGGR